MKTKNQRRFTVMSKKRTETFEFSINDFEQMYVEFEEQAVFLETYLSERLKEILKLKLKVEKILSLQKR